MKEREGGVSCVPGHPFCTLQGQRLGLVWGCWTGGAAEGGAVGGRGVTGGIRVLQEKRDKRQTQGGKKIQQEKNQKFILFQAEPHVFTTTHEGWGGHSEDLTR